MRRQQQGTRGTCAGCVAACRTHTHTCSLPPFLSLFLSSPPLLLAVHSLSFCLPQLICIILIWHFCPRRRQAPGGGHIKAFTWKHIQLHAICINCSVLSLSQRLSLSFAAAAAAVVAACQPKLLPFDFGNYNAFLCNNLSFVLSRILSFCLFLPRSLLDLLCLLFAFFFCSPENFNFSSSCDIGSQFQVNYLLGLGQ